MGYTAINFVPSYLGKVSTLNGHGYSVGSVVRLNGAVWTLALADNTTDALSIGIVSQVIDANTFVVTQAGWIYNITSPATVTAGTLYYLSGVTPGLLTNSPGAISIPLLVADSSNSGFFFNSYPQSSSPSGITWSAPTVDTLMVKNNGYICNSGSNLNMTLPSSFSTGDVVYVIAYNTGGFTIVQGINQTIRYGNDITTAGPPHGIVSTAQGDSLTIVGVSSNLNFVVTDSVGNFTIV